MTAARSLVFINRVYPPDTAATGQLLSQLAASLAAAGWRVTVLTSRTTSKAPLTEVTEGVWILRVRGLPFTRSNHLLRAIAYLSLYPAFLWRLIRLPAADVVVTMTDPPMQLVLGLPVKWLKGSRLVHWAQDIYPELAEALGVLRVGGLMSRILRALSNWALSRYDRIVSVGRCMSERLHERGLAPESITVIPNWADTQAIRPINHGTNPLRTEWSLEDRFVVMYAGNLGLAHPVEAILEAAQLLIESAPNTLFLFVGEGPRLSWLSSQAQALQLDNVRFLPFQPTEKLAYVLSAADVHLAGMYDRLCGLVVPSKVYGVMAAGRPCLFLGPEGSEIARLIREHDCGAVVPSADGATVAAVLARWQGERQWLEAAGCRARRAAEGSTLADAAAAFAATLRGVCAGDAGTGQTRAAGTEGGANE